MDRVIDFIDDPLRSHTICERIFGTSTARSANVVPVCRHLARLGSTRSLFLFPASYSRAFGAFFGRSRPPEGVDQREEAKTHERAC